MYKILNLFILVCLLSGCGVAKTLPTTHESTEYSAKADSVYVRDSIYVDRWHTVVTKGDTVYVTDTKTEYRDRYRDREVHDTLYVDKEVVVTQEIPAELTWWQSFKLEAFWWLAVVVLIAVISKFRKFI